MDIQLSHPANCTPGAVRTRRPVSGILSHAVAVPILHAALARSRVAVVHQVETEIRPGWEDLAVSIPSGAENTVRVLVPTGQRASWLAVAVVYLADPGAALDLQLYTLAGVLVDSVTIAGGALPSTREFSLFGYYYRQGYATTGEVRQAAAAVRPLQVIAGAGTTLELRCVPSAGAGTRVQVLSVAVYELAEVTVPA